MKINEKGNLKFITFDNIDKTGIVVHAFSTRLGGVSKGELESLNLGFSRGDELDNVIKNYSILGDAVGFDYKSCIGMKQTHETKVKVVSKNDCGMGILCNTKFIGYDAMITNDRNVTLVTYHADCVPIYYVDVKNKAIGLAHAGWRGTVNSMAKAVVEKMKSYYGSNPKDIQVAIGPSIGVCCFEVDKPVADEFYNKHNFTEKYIVKTDNVNDKYKIDLWGVNKEILINSGIPEENIEVTTMCTKCNPEYFYSHRNMGDKRGSMAAFLMLK